MAYCSLKGRRTTFMRQNPLTSIGISAILSDPRCFFADLDFEGCSSTRTHSPSSLIAPALVCWRLRLRGSEILKDDLAPVTREADSMTKWA